MLQGVGRWPVDTAEEAAVRRRRGGRRGEVRKKREGGRAGRRATHCGGQSALTATGVAEWDLSRLDRWTDRATPHWQTLALDAGVSAQTHQRALTNTLTYKQHMHKQGETATY